MTRSISYIAEFNRNTYNEYRDRRDEENAAFKLWQLSGSHYARRIAAYTVHTHHNVKYTFSSLNIHEDQT